MSDRMVAVVEGEVLECVLSSGEFNAEDGRQVTYRNWKMSLFNRGNADIVVVTVPGDLADQTGLPGVGDVVAYRCEVRAARGALAIKAKAMVASSKPNGAAPAPPPAARSRA